jgi:hypothetical protein
MGLFDAFGVGGGSLSIQVQSPQVQAGGVVYGAVVFTAGRRAQQITNVTVKLTCTRQVPQASGQMMQQTQEVVPAYAVTGAFAAQPGQTYQFPFQLQIPPDAFGSQPDLVTWRVSGNADIDGEIDPGAGLELMVAGTHYVPQGMVPMGGPTYQPMGGKDPYAQGKGMNPNDPYGKGVNPNDPYGKGVNPYDPYGKGVDPNDPYGKGVNPYDPYGKGKGGGKY